jgi:hypothetical protein
MRGDNVHDVHDEQDSIHAQQDNIHDERDKIHDGQRARTAHDKQDRATFSTSRTSSRSS